MAVQTDAMQIARHAALSKLPQRRDLEAICDEGREWADSEDDAHWKLGELALEIETAYGKENIKQFAKAIGKAKATTYEYRKVFAFYRDILPLADFRDANPMLRYSHFRDAMRLPTPEAALAHLNAASANGYTVEEARVAVAKALGKPFTVGKRSFAVDGLAGAPREGRATLLMYGGAADALAVFIAEHKSDPEYGIEIVVTYRAKEEQP